MPNPGVQNSRTLNTSLHLPIRSSNSLATFLARMEALTKREAIPEKAIALISKLVIPKWMYIWMGNHGWKQEAKKIIDGKKFTISHTKTYKDSFVLSDFRGA